MTREEKQKRNEAIIAKGKKGVTVWDLADEYSLSVSSIRDILGTAGVKARMTKGAGGPTKLERVKKLLHEGQDMEKIAEQVEVPIYTVRHIARQEGLFQSPTKDKQFVIIKELINGRGAADIAKEMGFTRSYVSSIHKKCREYGIVEV